MNQQPLGFTRPPPWADSSGLCDPFSGLLRVYGVAARGQQHPRCAAGPEVGRVWTALHFSKWLAQQAECACTLRCGCPVLARRPAPKQSVSRRLAFFWPLSFRPPDSLDGAFISSPPTTNRTVLRNRKWRLEKVVLFIGVGFPRAALVFLGEAARGCPITADPPAPTYQAWFTLPLGTYHVTQVVTRISGTI